MPTKRLVCIQLGSKEQTFTRLNYLHSGLASCGGSIWGVGCVYVRGEDPSQDELCPARGQIEI